MQALYHLVTHPAQFHFIYFSGRAHIFAQGLLDYNPIYTSQVAGMTDMCHYA
jgi:hypothetical protein